MRAEPPKAELGAPEAETSEEGNGDGASLPVPASVNGHGANGHGNGAANGHGAKGLLNGHAVNGHASTNGHPRPPEPGSAEVAARIRSQIREVAGGQYRDWDSRREALLPRILELKQAAAREARAQRAALGNEEDFLALVDKNGVSVQSDEGRAELTNLDGTPIVRIVLKGSEQSFLCLDTDVISPTSKHLKKLIARQHLDSGKSRADGKNGRDVVLVWTQGESVVETIYLSRPWMFSPRWWKEYVAAVVKKPSMAHLGLGTACAIAQTGLALCVAGVKQMLNPEAPFEYQPAVLSAIFGMVLGINVKTYKAWCLIGPKISQVTKSALVSLLFAYSLIAWTDGATTFNPFDAAFWLIHFHVITNAMMNNWAKVEWHQINRLRERNRLNTNAFQIWIPGKGWVETGVSWADIEHQAVYLIPFTLRLADLTRLAIPFDSLKDVVPGLEPLLGNGLPLGKALLYGSIPLAQYLVLKYAERHGLEGAEQLRGRFERMKARTKNFLVNVPEAALNVVAQLLGAPPEFRVREAFRAVLDRAWRLVGFSSGCAEGVAESAGGKPHEAENEERAAS